MNQKLYRLHESYNKHNLLHTGCFTAYLRSKDELLACTCGGHFALLQGNGFIFNPGPMTGYIYLSSLIDHTPEPMQRDLRIFIRKLTGEDRYRQIVNATLEEKTELWRGIKETK